MKSNRQYKRYARALDCEHPGKRRMRNVGLICIAIGLALSFLAIMLCGDTNFTCAQQTVIVPCALGFAFIGFGTGWQCHEEADRDGELE